MSEVKTNKISSVSTNGDITLDPDGTGAVVVDAPIKLDGNYPTGTENVALGDTALDSVESGGQYNVAVGSKAGTAITTGDQNVAVGAYSLDATTTGSNNTAVGKSALGANTTASNNTALGTNALLANTTGTRNTAVGSGSLDSVTTGQRNAAVGYNALQAQTTTNYNTAIGDIAGQYATGEYGTFIGMAAGENTTGSRSTFVGSVAGASVTTGAGNTILGRYNGNQGGLDIRTSSNFIVLSDGYGNPRVYVNGSGRLFSYGVYDATTGTGANVAVDSNGHLQRSTSSQRYKNTINDATHGLTELMNLRPVTYKHNSNGDVIFGGLIAEEVHTAGLTEFVEYSQDDNGDDQPEALHYGNMVSLCIKAIQELKTDLDAEKAKTATLQTQVADLITRVTALEDA